MNRIRIVAACHLCTARLLPKEYRMNRRAFLAASCTVAGTGLLGRSALARQVQIKGCGATFPRQVFEAWSEAGLNPTGIKMTYDGTSSAEGLDAFRQKRRPGWAP